MKVFVSIFILVIGFIAFFFLWPKSIDLPNIGKVKEWKLSEVSGNDMSIEKKPKLISFYYTNCPDICPTTMMDLKKLQQLMNEKGISEDQYIILSVTLDPEYDTNKRILEYKNLFEISSPNWLFLRGSEEDTKELTNNFDFYYKKDENGFLTHSTSMYIVDSNDQIRAHHDMAIGNKRVNIEEIANHLQQLIK
ncbi:SCO family protein [Bacillus sp. Cr_A10]|uniref:SCO family protein n=1 Tax=Bacillus sp. Cr_A10 TaxID=3033993 RepID=UPI0023DAC5B3|nr:SCO family protein [Bacillus sp. Cr_A10]MDF2066996.1 SCO family protein [Bacillus sp. Cr_A10]